MKKDAIHIKQIVTTKDSFVNDDNFDSEEASEAGIDERKFALKRLFSDMRPTSQHRNNGLFEVIGLIQA